MNRSHFTKLPCALLAASALLAGSRAAGAWAAVPDWAPLGALADEEYDKAHSSLPQGYARDKLLKMLHPMPLAVTSSGVEAVRLLTVKPWEGEPGLAVAALQTRRHNRSEQNSRKEVVGTLYLALFSGGSEGAPIKVEARAAIPTEPGQTLAALLLDPLPLSRDRKVLGARLEEEAIYADGRGRNEYLSLLLVDGRDIRPVWTTLVSSSSSPEPKGKKATRSASVTAKLAVKATVSNGLSDVEKTSGQAGATYSFDGKAYRTAGRDPVVDVNPHTRPRAEETMRMGKLTCVVLKEHAVWPFANGAFPRFHGPMTVRCAVPVERVGNNRNVTLQLVLEVEGTRAEVTQALRAESRLDFEADSGAKTMEIAAAVPEDASECVGAKVTVSAEDAKRTLTGYPGDCDD